jgi:pimeloyl-ACP methyl ester carboxylesterase
MPDRQTLILLPGLLCAEPLWRQQVEALSDLAEIRVADLTRADSMRGMAEAVLADAPDRFALAGLSMGGYAAQEIMRIAPQRVERLALLDTSARADPPERREARRRQIDMAQEGRFDEVVDTMFLPSMQNPDNPFPPELRETVRAMCAIVGPQAFVRQQTAIMNRPDSRPDLPRIACPTLVLCGRQDQPTPIDAHEEMAAAIPNATLVVIEDCGHLSTMERPQAVNAAMRDWLAGPRA